MDCLIWFCVYMRQYIHSKLNVKVNSQRKYYIFGNYVRVSFLMYINSQNFTVCVVYVNVYHYYVYSANKIHSLD